MSLYVYPELAYLEFWKPWTHIFPEVFSVATQEFLHEEFKINGFNNN